jgi:Ribosomal protein L7/L12 C-terminal domain
MASRYLITGVQLGMLIALPDMEERQKLVDQIDKQQYVGYGTSDITDDVKRVVDTFGRTIRVMVGDLEYWLTNRQFSTIKSFMAGSTTTNKISAIKFIRDEIGLKNIGLKEAKDLVESPIFNK